MASRPDSAQRRRPHPGRPDDPRDLGGALRVVLAVYGRAGRGAANRRRPQRLLHLRRQPAAPLPRRRRRRRSGTSRTAGASGGPSSTPQGNQCRAGAVRGTARGLLRHPPPRPAGRERDRRLRRARQRQPGCCDAVPLARRVLQQARPGLPRERPADGRSSTPSATTRIRVTNSERPWAKHGGGTISEGDYDKLMSALTEAFRRHGQPLPGQGRVAIWYMEQGFQTTVDPAKASLYRGAETIRDALPPWLSRTVAASSDQDAAPDQATQLTDALQVAYCQPGVAAFFNFELADEPSLDGWQSGLLWTDGTPKPSYDAFKAATRTSRHGRSTARATRTRRERRRSASRQARRRRRRRRSRRRRSRRSSRSVASADVVVRVARRGRALHDRGRQHDPRAPRPPDRAGAATRALPRRRSSRARRRSATTTPRRRRSTTSPRATGEMEIDGDRRQVAPGDAILIPPGAWHQITAGSEQLRFLCCCAPAVPARGHVLRRR